MAELFGQKIKLKSSEFLLLSSSLSVSIWIKEVGNGKMAQQLRVSASLSWDPTSVPSQPLVTIGPGDRMLSSGLVRLTHTHKFFQKKKNYAWKKSALSVNHGHFQALEIVWWSSILFLNLFLLLTWTKLRIWASLMTWVSVERRTASSHCGFWTITQSCCVSSLTSLR